MISFILEVQGFKLTDRNKKKSLLKNLIETHQKKVGELNYIFLSDEELLKLNVEYLNHNTYTDIITFDNSEEEDIIEGDIFISVDRIKDNSEKFKVSFENELIRVISHGVLHLLGYKDKEQEDVDKMRKAEEDAIKQYFG